MIIYLVPTLLVLALIAAAYRVRQHIEPACPECDARDWHDTPTVLSCTSCGWTISRQAAGESGRIAA